MVTVAGSCSAGRNGRGSAPIANSTSTPDSFARRPSSGEITCGGETWALPPPSTRASAASAPITATLVSAAGSRGSV